MLSLLVVFLCSIATAAPSLRSLTLLETADDDNQIAAVVQLDADTGVFTQIGKNFSWSTEAALSMDCVTAFAPAVSGYPARWMSAVGSGPSIATVDASSGVLVGTSPSLSPSYILASMSWDATLGLLVAVAGLGDRVDLVTVNATTGIVSVLASALALPFPQACQSALSLVSGTFYTVSNDKANDDADQTVDAYALSNGTLLASAAWPALNAGALGRPLVVPAASADGEDTLVLSWAAPDSGSGAGRPLRFLQLDVRSGAQRVLAELPASFSGVVIDAGGQSPASPARAANGSFSMVAFGFDNPSDTAYLLRVGPISSGASGPLAAVAMTALVGSGFPWAPVLLD